MEENRWWRWSWESSGPLPQHPPQLSLVPPRAPGSESVEDAIIAIVDAGRKDFTPCVLVEKPDYPGSRNAHTWLFEDQENDTAPATLPVPGESTEDIDYPF
jgi:hypothetical protein